MTFAGIALAPSSIPEGFSVFSLLHSAARSLSSSQAADCNEIGGEYFVSRNIYTEDKTFMLEQWFDENLVPLRFEIALDGARIIEARYIQFETK